MQKMPLYLSAGALALSLVALFRPAVAPVALAAAPDRWKAERNYPPLVFSSRAWLDCSISSTANGRQILRTVSGQGFTFDAPMRPIKGGLVKLKAPGMLYKFDAFPTGVVPARFSGLGAGVLTEMKTEVEVDVKRYEQPGGPGTNIRFRAPDINGDAAYVEFTGVFVRTGDRKRFPFRVLFGSVPTGGGNVTPGSSRPEAPLMSKSVRLGTPERAAPVTTALYEAEEDVPVLK